MGIDTHFQGVYDTRVLGLELGDGAVAAILLRVVYIAHGIVAEDGVKSGVCEAERRYGLRGRICEAGEGGKEAKHFF